MYNECIAKISVIQENKKFNMALVQSTISSYNINEYKYYNSKIIQNKNNDCNLV